MLAEKKTNTNLGVGVGFILQVVANIWQRQDPSQFNVLAMSVGLLGVVLFIWGCVNYMQGKGYSGWFGLLGLLSCLGLIALVCFPDKNK